MRYIPSSETDRREMLSAIGVSSVEDLFASIPENLRLGRLLNLPQALSEAELLEYFQKAAAENAAPHASFLGAGVYRHHIPLIIDALISRSEFYTAYTPYQPEIAQGTLQAIFEFQTYITQLTGMDVSNASLYDGSTGFAEALLMAHRITRRKRFLVARTVHPQYRAVMETYARNLGIEMQFVGYTPEGRVDEAELERLCDGTIAAIALQTPNFFGTIETSDTAGAIAKKHGALLIINVCEALSMGILAPPLQADIVTGEAQSFGIPLNFGGPHLGFLATKEQYLRQMPGRLAGMGKDQQGRRAFVLTLSTREQHIRREKATSNICTNQSLCALMATIYLATLGPAGLREAAEQNIRKTAYAVRRIESNTRHKVLFPASRFNEFVVQLQGQTALDEARTEWSGIVPGLRLGSVYPELGNALLVCVTETARREHIDSLVEILQ
jgi:glycine dehydrogenase subunit 1